MWSLWAWTVLAGEPEAQERFVQSIERMHTASTALQDATYRFFQEELVKCKRQPKEEMNVKYRRPQDIYMTWVGDEKKGQQVLFRKGKDKGKMLADPGPWIPSLWLDARGNLATRGQRHSIYRMGFLELDNLFQADARLIAEKALDPVVKDEGIRSIHGDPARCYTVEFPKDQEPGLYAPKVELCFSEKTHLSTSVKTWMHECGKLQVVEEYSFADVKVNVGLGDADFDPKSKEYGF